MSPSETQSVLTVSLLAAFADGDKHDRERTEIKRIADGLSQAEGIHLPSLYQDVLMKRVSLDSAAAPLASGPVDASPLPATCRKRFPPWPSSPCR